MNRFFILALAVGSILLPACETYHTAYTGSSGYYGGYGYNRPYYGYGRYGYHRPYSYGYGRYGYTGPYGYRRVAPVGERIYRPYRYHNWR